MEKTFSLGIQIGAVVSGSLKTAVRSSTSQLQHLGSAIKGVRGQQQMIGRFQLADASLGKTRVAYEAVTRDLMRLRKQIAATDKPGKQLLRNFDETRKRAEKLSAKLEYQKNTLRQVRQELIGAGINTRNLAGENTRLGAIVDRLNVRYRKLNQAVQAQQQLKARRADLRGQLFDAVALGASVIAPVRVAVNFEQSIARLGSITGADAASLQSLEKMARKLGETTTFTASQSADAMTYLGMAGFKTNQILAATPGMLRLAIAAGSDLATTADIASNILSGFSLAAEETGRVGDVLSATFTSSNTTLQMLGDTLKYAAPVASSVGTSLEELAAMAGLLGNVGIQGGMAGTVLRAALLRLSSPPREAADAIEQLGVSLVDAGGNLRSVPQLLQEIAAATDSMGSADRADLIQKLFGTEAAAGMAELLKQSASGGLTDFVNKLQSSSGATGELARRMNDTTRGSLKRLGSALESLAINIGDVLLPSIVSIVDVLSSVASGVASLSRKFPVLSQVVVGLTAGLIGLKVVSIAGAYAFTFLQGGFLMALTAGRALAAGLTLAQLGFSRLNLMAGVSAIRLGLVTAAQWAMNVAMYANPIGLIVAGITALAGAAWVLFQYWEPVGDFFGNLWQGIMDSTTDAVNWIMEKLQVISAPLSLMGYVWDKVSGAFQSADAVTAGAAVAANASASVPEVLGKTDYATAASRVEQTVQIDAPVTVNAQPGMNSREIAVEVRNALQEQQHRAVVDRRSVLHDL